MSNIDFTNLKSFILEASRATYASGDVFIKHKQPDGSTTINYKNGNYRYNDNYFGGEPYGGREVVFLDGKPIWMMVYYGLVYEGANKKEVYPFLMESLSNSNLEMPYRGPSLYQKGDWKYENVVEGEVNNFHGIEKIFRDGVCVYEARYMGGLVDC